MYRIVSNLILIETYCSSVSTVLDASGEPKAGFFYGNRFWLGVKTQCLSIHDENVGTDFPPFQVNYYAAHFQYPISKQENASILLYS